MYKSDSSVMSYLNPKSGINNKKSRMDILKQVWKWTKIALFLFIIISMLWGCVQMYQNDYMVSQVVDMTGNKVYAPGTSFEIIIRSLGEIGGKSHIINVDGYNLVEYGYNTITSWADAFNVTHSPFYGFFVYPTGYILVGILHGFAGTLNPGLDSASQASYGVAAFFAILFTVIIVRCITLAFSWKSQMNQDRMADLQLKQAEITAKYKGKKDTQSRQKQQAETQALYKKEGLSPMSAMVGSFASMPFLFAIYAIIRSTRALKIATIGQVSLIEQPWGQVTSGHMVYFALLAVYLPLQILSMLLPTLLQYYKNKGKPLTEDAKKARKRQLIMQLVMSVVFIFVVATVASGVAIYWILSSTFQICQTLGFFYYHQHKRKGGNQEQQRRLKQLEKQKPTN